MGRIDQSKGYAEMEYYYPALAKEHLMMPLRMLGLREDMAQVKGILTSFADNIKIFAEAMHEHMVLIRALQAVAERMEKAILEMRGIKRTLSGE